MDPGPSLGTPLGNEDPCRDEQTAAAARLRRELTGVGRDESPMTGCCAVTIG
jgi:hypothetical protein